MSLMRNEWITGQLRALLERRTPPPAIRLRPEHQAAEIASLARAVLRHAPHQGWEEWWEKFEDTLLAESSTHAWPHAGDIEKVGKQLRPKGQPRLQEEVKIDPHDIVGKAMQAGQPVSEHFLYGRRCLDLLASGQTDRATVERYRDGLFMAERSMLGEERARRREVERLEKHEAAARVRTTGGDTTPTFPTMPEPKRMTPVEADAEFFR